MWVAIDEGGTCLLGGNGLLLLSGCSGSWCLTRLGGLLSAGCVTRGLGFGRCPEGLGGISVTKLGMKGIARTYEIVPEKLHDESGVLVALLGEGVEFCTFGQCLVIIGVDMDTYQQWRHQMPAWRGGTPDQGS